MKKKFACELTLNDEFNCFFERRYQHCKVVKVPQVWGDTIDLHVAPIGSLGRSERIRLKADQLVETYTERTLTKNQRYQKAILSCLELGHGSLSAWEISQKIIGRGVQRFGLDFLSLSGIKRNCRTLALARQIVLRPLSGHVPAYRLPIADLTGLAVVEHPQSERRRCGWIAGKQFHSPSGTYHPIVEWEVGGTSFAHEEHLEPASGFDLRRLENLRLIREGKQPEGRVEIPMVLFAEWRAATRDGERSEVLLHIAKLLGWAPWDQERIKASQRNQAIDYLDIYYPGWRTGLAA